MNSCGRLRRGVGSLVLCVAVIGGLAACHGAHVPPPVHAHDDAPPAAHAHGAAQPGAHDATARHSFADVARWKQVFDDPARDAWQKPQALVDALDVRPGMRVADLGAGTGYFSRYLSAAVGADGTVYAVEPELNLVGYLRERAERERTDNVVPVLASTDQPRLPHAGVDVVLIVDTYHHIDDRLGYFRRLQQVLRPAGRVAVVDWRKEDLPVGPPPSHKLAREQIVDEMTRAGYRLVDEPTILPYQYFLVFQVRGTGVDMSLGTVSTGAACWDAERY